MQIFLTKSDENVNSIYQKVRPMISQNEQDHMHIIFLRKLAEKVGIGRKQRKQHSNWFLELNNTQMTSNLAWVYKF
jgi:hypothetical protein